MSSYLATSEQQSIDVKSSAATLLGADVDATFCEMNRRKVEKLI